MFVWQVCTGGSWKGSGAQWADYSDPLNTQFETAKQAGKHRLIRYTLRTQSYQIDLEGMTQTNLGFDTTRAMRRSWVEAADLISSQSALQDQLPEEFNDAVPEEKATTATPVLSIEGGPQPPQIKD